MKQNYFDETEIRKAIAQLKPDGQLFEIRVLQNYGGRKSTISGYFRDADKLIEQLKSGVDLRGANVYITLNQVNSALFSRIQSEHFLANVNTTKDNEIDGFQYLFIDFDPERPAGVSSTQEELEESYKVAGKVDDYLMKIGFEPPIKAVSGNGAHLLYRIQLKNTEENKQLVEKCLKVLDALYSTDTIKVDCANFNPSRICKLYGTLAQKGANTKDRPFRMSRIIGDVKELKVTDRVFLEKLSQQIEFEEPKPTRSNNYNVKEFDIEDWMREHGIGYKAKPWNNGTKYVLDECPFDSSHKAPDSAIFKGNNGAISFKCLHDHCQGYKWQDVRVKFEPDAYDQTEADRRIEEGWRQHNRDKTNINYEHIIENDKEPMFLTAEMILAQDQGEEEYIESGITVIDKRMKGLQKKSVSVISGLRGAAKSTILSGIMLNCVQQGHNVVCYSGELSSKNTLKWMLMQAAGKRYTKAYEKFVEQYYCPDEIKPKIAKWLGTHFKLYNNKYGNNFSEIGNKLREEIKRTKADLCVVDNLMALDLSSFSQDKYDAQTKFVWDLKDIAINCNVHVIFVAHPKKSQGFLRLDDISGSGNISNIVDNAFIVHRNNEDFKRLTREMFKWASDAPAYQGTNVIEICKDRENGTQDLFIPLWYEPQTKRLRNNITENIIYGWDDSAPDQTGFISVDADGVEVPF